jgi:hypothetical protein
MRLLGKLLIIVAVLGLAVACGKKTGEDKKDEAKKEESAVKKTDEKKDEAAPAEEKKEEAAPVEEKKEEVAPVEEKKEEAAPVKEKKEEVAPAEEKKEEVAPVEEKKEEAAAAMTATYAIAEMDDAKIKALTMALADKDGVISAKADKEAGTFNVTFKKGSMCPGKIAGALKGVEENVEFKGMEAADGSAVPDHGSCGGCPNKGACGH